jgi:hypothetical protein
LSYEEALRDIPIERMYLFQRWGEKAGDGELRKAAAALIVADARDNQLKHLAMFGRRAFPEKPDAVLLFAKSEDPSIRHRARLALEHLSDPRIRELALLLRDVDLMIRNAASGDHAVIMRWIIDEEDSEKLHSLQTGAPEFWTAHPNSATEATMLRAVYERGPCSFCRERIVTRLMEREALTPELRAECLWDGNYEIRDLMTQRLWSK